MSEALEGKEFVSKMKCWDCKFLEINYDVSENRPYFYKCTKIDKDLHTIEMIKLSVNCPLMEIDERVRKVISEIRNKKARKLR